MCIFGWLRRVTHYGYNLAITRPIDVDRDGLDELLMFSSRSSSRCDYGGELSCMRGIGRQAWKRLGDPGQPIHDLDQDGIRDFVSSWGDGTLRATSGATAKLLWQTDLSSPLTP